MTPIVDRADPEPVGRRDVVRGLAAGVILGPLLSVLHPALPGRLGDWWLIPLVLSGVAWRVEARSARSSRLLLRVAVALFAAVSTGVLIEDVVFALFWT